MQGVWDVVDPYVQLDVHGVPVDCVTATTRAIDNNGFNPYWNETFEFVVQFPEMALVRFAVFDNDCVSGDDFLGQFVVPFDLMAPGYRHIVLQDHMGNDLPRSTLFVKVGYFCLSENNFLFSESNSLLQIAIDADVAGFKRPSTRVRASVSGAAFFFVSSAGFSLQNFFHSLPLFLFHQIRNRRGDGPPNMPSRIHTSTR